MSELGDKLWNASVTTDQYGDNDARYRLMVLEQYRLCVEMADRVSARRNNANTYFLSLNTALVGVVVAVAGKQPVDAPVWLLAAGVVILLIQCATWFAIVRSYRLLNKAKWAVVAALEERLPALASRAEWHELGEGRDWRRYLQLSHVEQGVPIIYAVAYLVGFAALAT